MRRILPVLLFLCFLFFAHSSYAQNIGGIGAQLLLDTSGGTTMPRIMSFVPGTPANQKLKATDYIIKVNGVSCKNKTLEEIITMIRGEEGTMVKITVADTKEGKREREYELPRVVLQGAAAPDPLASFNSSCDMEVRQLKKSGKEIVKTFPSECGNYFFNFNAEAHTYHVLIMTMEDKPKVGEYKQEFFPTARVFNSDNEAGAITLPKGDTKEIVGAVVARAEGDISFTKNGVGVVNVELHDDATKCRTMFVVIYR